MYLIVKSYLVPRPHFSSRPKHFGSRGPCENARPFPARSPRIRHRNELTESDWENAVQGLGKLQRRYSEINEDCEDDWEGLRPRQSFVFAAISLNCKLGYVILQFGRAIGRTFFEANSRVLKVKNRALQGDWRVFNFRYIFYAYFRTKNYERNSCHIHLKCLIEFSIKTKQWYTLNFVFLSFAVLQWL